MNWEQYFTIADGLVSLMDPLMEIVIHNTQTNKIIFIKGYKSQRKIGDSSLLDEDDINSIEQQVVYTKLNFDGKLIRSISIPIKNHNLIVGLMCINYDITAFQEMNTLTTLFLAKSLEVKPQALFKNDWQDRIHETIHKILQEKNLQFNNLTNQNKKELTHKLYELGAFAEKNAADYIASILDISRATVFNYLKLCRKDNNVS